MTDKPVLETHRGDGNRPIKSEPIGEGAMGRVSRIFFADGTTRVTKTAKKPEDNAFLKTEYEALASMSGRRPSIPRVYRDFPTSSLSEVYSFQMEDLGGFKPLLGKDYDLTQNLDTFEKIFILMNVADALNTANASGWIHRDLSSSNIMYNAPETKLVDWADATRLTEQNKMTDVNVAKEYLPNLFQGLEFVPPTIRPWISATFTNPQDAWEDLLRRIKECPKEEIEAVEKDRVDVFGNDN